MESLLYEFNKKELATLEKHLLAKGVDVLISLCSSVKSDMSQTENSMFVSASYGTFFKETPVERKLIFLNDSFEFKEINLFSVADETNSFNLIHAFISGGHVPKNSTIEFAQFPSIKLIVDEVQVTRPLSLAYRYTLSRG